MHHQHQAGHTNPKGDTQQHEQQSGNEIAILEGNSSHGLSEYRNHGNRRGHG
jgi:hypothetical protein